MKKARLSPMHFPEFIELKDTFNELLQPYGLKDIIRFNQVYERIYLNLRHDEKRRAEIFSDTIKSE
jgi:hypothetical protein